MKAFRRKLPAAHYIIFGSVKVLSYHSKHLKVPLPGKVAQIIDIDNISKPYFGPSAEQSGKASVEYLERAFEFYSESKIDALVTGPIQKESWHRAGYKFPGQTEFCAEKTGSKKYCMLMAGETFRIALLSTHLPLQEALKRISTENILAQLKLLDHEFRKFGYKTPQIGVAAVNPHAGEAGILGEDEARTIIPAIEQAQADGINAEGPIAPEVIFRVAARQKRWDVILAMYHDQAMIPLKLVDFERSANVTLGLPLIRTSPDHGTAFDIAGKGKANPGSMVYAIKIAAERRV
ncbi:4-hydroxythreonine-4-phosphate dehydrogenase PdxA [bacterium]|nr:4-hydroxythreonine-4-phosphate dehydrogenase PdxA [bacterium]